MMDEITIDRLVLDIPGITPGQARDLAERIGSGLAAATDRANSSPAIGDAAFDGLSIDLDDCMSAANLPHLANLIVSTLLRQMGRS